MSSDVALAASWLKHVVVITYTYSANYTVSLVFVKQGHLIICSIGNGPMDHSVFWLSCS